MGLPNKPITRKEHYLAKIAGQNVGIPDKPKTREEQYLDEIARHGGGGGGTSDYTDLDNKPQINNITLSGNKSTEDLIPIGDGLTFDEDGKLKATGGSGGTTDYTDLENKPQINDVELTGNKSLHDLGIAGEDSIGTMTDAQWTSVQAILS